MKMNFGECIDQALTQIIFQIIFTRLNIDSYALL